MKTRDALGVALAVGLMATSAQAQKQGQQTVDSAMPATYGAYSLNAGFSPDPYTIGMTSGGAIDAANVAQGCVGMVARAPDVEITYTSGSLPLIFRTAFDSDVTLLINGPDGRWSCDDDSGEGTNAELVYESPRSGVYDVWVGAYGGGGSSGSLLVTELRNGGGGGGGGGGDWPDSSLTATYGERSLSAGFSPDPYEIQITAGGTIDATQLGAGCSGMIARAPDFQLSYSAGSLPLIFGATADRDTTLVINGPDGRWYCDDDSADAALDPLVRFNNPASGVYDVWIGTFSGGYGPAELYISELRGR